MRHKKIHFGLKENLDKLMFILATTYLVIVGCWFLTTNKSTSKVVKDNIAKETTITPEKLPEENKEKFQLNEEQKPEKNLKLQSNSQVISSPIIDNSNPNISLVNSSKNLLIPEPPPLPSPSPLPVTQSISSSETMEKTSIMQIPSKIKIPPSPKPQSVIKVKSVPVLNSNNNRAYNTEQKLVSPLSTVAVNYNHTLVGLIELQDHSMSALFKINEIAQRVNIGEEIGVSGWFLIAINEKEAVINQQGKTIRLAVGEKF